MRNLKSLLIICLLALFGCADDNESNSGRLNVLLTDAPFPTDMVQSASVTIDKVEARRSDESDESPFVVLSEDQVTIDLLTLRNGLTASLAEIEVPVGSYDLVRLYISDASVELQTGEQYDVNVPSGAETGLKIFISPEIEVSGGLTSDLLLDFDVSQSFVVQGPMSDPNGFIFKPTIKAANMSSVGRLEGIVIDANDTPIEGAEVAVYAADTLNTTTFTSNNGAYAVLGLMPGEYKVIYSYDNLSPVTEDPVEIVVANKTTVDVTLE